MENQSLSEKNNKRKAIVLLVVALIVVIVMIAGATYAYFQAQQGTGQSSDVNVTTGTTDNLNFNITDLDVTRTDIVDEDQSSEVPITINASMNNFTDQNTSLGDGVTATATLIANDATNKAEGNYYVYLNISKNELQYSSYKRNNPLDPDTDNKNTLVFKTPEEKSDAELGEYSSIPELYLTIKKNGTEITSGVTIKDTELTHVEGILVDPENADDPTNKTLGGFDITETKGLIKIEDQQTINVEEGTDNNTKTDNWEIIVTFMNLGTDQNLNTGKKLEGKVIIQEEEYIQPLAELCTGEKAAECFTKNYKNDPALVFHNGTTMAPNTVADFDEYAVIASSFKITEKYAADYQHLYVDEYDEWGTTHLIKYMCDGEEDYVGILRDPCSLGSEGEYYVLDYAPEQHYATFKLAIEQALKDEFVEPAAIDANDDSYRYSGGNDIVHNYVCFGGNCSNDTKDPGYKNLYRIIGFFKNDDNESEDYEKYEMKIIKADGATKEDLGEGTYPTSAHAGNYSASNGDDERYYKSKNWTNLASYYWNSTVGTTYSDNNINMWSASNLNINNLNKTYYNGIDETYRNMIEKHKWQVGGINSKIVVDEDARSTYELELGNEKILPEDVKCYTYTQGFYFDARPCNEPNDLVYEDHVGLMYASDYMYGTLPRYWIAPVKNYGDSSNIYNNNWLYLGVSEWTISRDASNYEIYSIYNYGDYGSTEIFGSDVVRPVLYLSSDVKITGGSGTDDDPFQLSM